MNLPALPTDNLYKFLALSGLVLFVISFVFPRSLVDELELKTVETQTEVNLLVREVSALNKDVDVAAAKPNLSDEALEKLSERRDQLNEKAIRLEGQKERQKTLLKQLRYAVDLSLFGSILGYLIAHVGFWLWYTRVQRLADLLARKQASATDD